MSSRIRDWSRSAPNWEPAEFCQEHTARFLLRTASLQHRLEMPLIVAMLGGTGTGKSTLLNALVGEHVVEEGKERPTTAIPVLVCHNAFDPTSWNIDLSGIQIEKRNDSALEQMVILDCPDPDTTENDEFRETNLARLRAVLPLCDVLLVTATQQKYRSRRVLDELASAAPGARLVFVQTHADRDSDIRDDWTELLKKDYETGRIFFVDSVAALKSQQNNQVPAKEFADLQRLLTVELNEEAAIRIRQSNFFGLAEETVEECRREIGKQWDVVSKLRDRISEERRRFGERLAEKMRNELIRDRRRWESRLVERVASQWGYSPFSIVLRIYQGCGAILSGALLTRVRSVPQLALWGTFEGIRSFRNWSNARKAKKKPVLSDTTTWEEGRLRESALILVGFVTDAKLPTASCEPEFVLEESKQAGEAFAADISNELETICNHLADRNNCWWIRAMYEILFGGMLLFILLRPAKNFFIDTLFDKTVRLYGADFYLISIFWLIVWASLLLGLFTFTLRRGLNREINTTSAQWGRLPALEHLFESVEQETNRIMAYRDELEMIYQRIERINQQSEKLDRRLGQKKVRE
jgi:GTPase SAR1 family protein